MKRMYSLLTMLMLALLPAFSQQDTKAKALLDQTAAAYRKAGGVSVRFSGTQSGTILLKGDKFYLDCGGVKSWFDGRTQWSYVEQNEEVNVSNPTAEELQSINPYALIAIYQQGYNYRYAGNKTLKGKSGQQVVLTPKTEQDIKQIVLLVGKDSTPQYIAIETHQGDKQEFVIQSYQTGQNLSDQTFRFHAKDYPNAEVIDLR